jgi:hypothetical protein
VVTDPTLHLVDEPAKGNDLRDQTVRDTATVTVSEPVPNRVPRRKRHHGHKPPKALPIEHITVDPRVMEAAKPLVRPGITRLVIVDSETVRIVNVTPTGKRVRKHIAESVA